MRCRNCNHELDPAKDYCPNCGAKVIRNRLTMKNISADINDQFFNLDNKLLVTYMHLIVKPEAVINSFISGTRKKYINVIQFFAIALTFVGVQVFLMNTFFKEAMELDPNLFTPMGDLESQKNNPMKDFKYADFNNYQSVFYTLSVPFSAISTYLTYWVAGIRHYNFTEHLVLNLYYSGVTIITNAILIIALLSIGVDFMIINYIGSVLILIYFYYVLKRVFNTSWLLTFALYMLMFVGLGAIFVVLILFVAVLIIGGAYIGKKTGIL